MRRIGSRELKNRLGKYLRAVRQGQTLLITDRGRPIAQLGPAPTEPNRTTLENRLKELEAQGLIRLAQRPMGNFKAVPSRGKSASQMLIEDRR
jgi:prevent-host-death family protein